MPLWLITIKIYAHIPLEVTHNNMDAVKRTMTKFGNFGSIRSTGWPFSMKCNFQQERTVYGYSYSPSNNADFLPKYNCNQSGFRNVCMRVSVCVCVHLFAGLWVCVCVCVPPASFPIFHQAVCCQAVLYSEEPFDQSQGIECVSAEWRTATTLLPGASSL